MVNSDFLAVALSAVTKAEKLILNSFNEDLVIETKSDRSPVTNIDREVEQLIRAEVLAAFPDHNILGEEAGGQKSTSAYLWIIDPIDGTKNYLRKIPLFSTQLALMKDEKVILGVSNAPAMKELFYAEKGKGAFLNHQRTFVSNQAKLESAYLCYGSVGYFNQAGKLDQFLNLEKNTLGHRGYGEFWGFHLLAQGKVDIMLEAQTKIWDVAALSLIIEEAGGRVTDINGQPITSRTDSIIATNGLLHPLVQEYFN